MLCLTAVFAVGTLSESGYIGLMGLLIGYLVGNGVAARAGDPVEPVLGESVRHRANRDDPPA